jgi:MerR family transcriptional regulator, mercuric resistance operon regulatory protein
VTGMTIGALARAAGVNIETVRYYERRGLLAPPARSGAGYRQYDDDALWRLQFVARAKQLGFTLSEIGELLVPGAPQCAGDVTNAARAKLTAVDEQMRDLVATRDRLERLVQTCEDGDAGDCVALAITDE